MIYSNLDDSDGVLGAFKKLEQTWLPNASERIVALEASGNLDEALLIYQNLPTKKERFSRLPKCLLRLNQPQLALGIVSTALRQEEDKEFLEKMKSYQIEATWRLGEWNELDELLKDTKVLNVSKSLPVVNTWNSNLASILSSIKHRQTDETDDRISYARLQVMNSLQSIALSEGTNSYSRAYKYMLRLHVLYEIEQAHVKLRYAKSSSTTSVFRELINEDWTVCKYFINTIYIFL